MWNSDNFYMKIILFYVYMKLGEKYFSNIFDKILVCHQWIIALSKLVNDS